MKSLLRKKNPRYLIGDHNINCLRYFENKKDSTFCISLFECGAIALINKPTWEAKKCATIIDNIITTNICDESLIKGTIEFNFLDHLPIFVPISTSILLQSSSPLKFTKSIFNKNSLASSKDQIDNINWDNLNSNQCSANSLYKTLLCIFKKIHHVNFPLTEIQIKPKKLKTSWLSKERKKSSRTKQRLYILNF